MAGKKLLIGAAAAIVGLAVLFAAAFLRDMHRAYDRVIVNGSLTASFFGIIEYTEGGTGPAVLVVHGSGGGYDQGELIARTVLDDNFYWIAPSRFGYLRSSLPDNATWDDQAHAYAYLLDVLGVSQVAIVAMSQGGPSALLFAALHPERVSSLTLISSGVASLPGQNQVRADEKGELLTRIFQHDLIYWAVSKVFRTQLLELMGATDSVVARMTSDQQELFDRFIDYMNPVRPRSAGVRFDNRAALPGDRIAAIVAPTLIIHAADDTLQLFHNAEFAARTIPDSTLLRFEEGGHFLIGTEQSAIRLAVRKHILEHTDTENIAAR